jgi:H+-transporting ATPase
MVEASIPQDGGLTTAEARHRLETIGPNEVPEERPHFLRTFVRRFWGPVPWMLEAALTIELVLQQFPGAAIIVALLIFNAILAQVQERRAQEALQLLRHRLRVTARVLRDGAWASLPARDLVPGDRIHLRMGDIVPSDCQIVEGEVEVDQSTITGESAAVTRSKGATIYSSSTLRRGEASADVTATGPRSFYGKTAELVRSARSVSHMERLLFSVVRYLVTLDGVLAATVLTVAVLRGVPLALALPFVVILLIASVPAAMPATFTIANALESRRLVEEGVLVTGLTAVQEAASMDMLCVDKTGTLTEGRETLSDVLTFGREDEAGVLSLAGAACDLSTQDTIDLAVLAEARKRGVPSLERTKFLPFDPALKRSEAWVTRAGRSVRVVLGSPSVVAGLCGSPPEMSSAVERLAGGGARVLAVAAGEEGQLCMVGLLALSDPPRADAAEMIRSLHEMGVRVVMLTGDASNTARAVARKVGLGDRLGERANLSEDPASYDGFAGIYPEDKYQLVQGLQAEGHIVGMTGDGVNDAPALKQAEVGIAVASSTDVARASAKLVLTRPGLKDLVNGIQGGRLVYRRMLTWTLNKVSKNFEQVFLFTVGFLATGLFVTSPFLILVMVFANDFVSMSVGTDNARISPAPDRWNVREIAEVAAVVGGCWLALSFTLLWWSRDVAHLALAPLQTFFFVYLVFSSQGTILLVRERGHAWSSRPSRVLLLAIVADGLAVTALAVTGTLMAPISPLLILLLLGAVALTALLVDQVKVWFIRRTGAFGEGSRFGISRKAPVS